ncbi:MAG: phytanoyl-CoA dioxygenase family protein [Actinomycetota bacterium]|nr:phytanoyl-CoA dioxygenase family protein [Actinomycetota bacterium]
MTTSDETGAEVLLAGVPSAWRRDGFALVRGLLDGVTLDECRDHLALVQKRFGVRLAEAAPIVAVPLGSDRFVTRITSDHRLTSLAAAVVGPAPRCFGYTYLVKVARTGPPALWHQDGHPWREQWGITKAVTVWVALDRTCAANGGLLVLPGSHHRPAAPLTPGAGWGPGLDPEPGQDGHGLGGMFGGGVDPGPGAASAVRALAMSPGDVSVHHPSLLHASGPNRSAAPRRAIAIRYVAG